MPNDQTSALDEYVPVRTSGAIYKGVPKFDCGKLGSNSSNSLENPKSPILATPFENRIFSGFRSL